MMTPFKRAYLPMSQIEAMAARLRRNGVAEETIMKIVTETSGDTIWRNNKYQVSVREIPATPMMPALLHLSIKTVDKKPLHDWRELQQIKNEICGPEYEGVELYPAESRLTDTANQYHLWVLADPEQRFPFGWVGRAVSTSEEASAFGATQRERSET